jgi:hypothetical protein
MLLDELMQASLAGVQRLLVRVAIFQGIYIATVDL